MPDFPETTSPGLPDTTSTATDKLQGMFTLTNGHPMPPATGAACLANELAALNAHLGKIVDQLELGNVLRNAMMEAFLQILRQMGYPAEFELSEERLRQRVREGNLRAGQPADKQDND
jgi:hypothetical protein